VCVSMRHCEDQACTVEMAEASTCCEAMITSTDQPCSMGMCCTIVGLLLSDLCLTLETRSSRIRDMVSGYPKRCEDRQACDVGERLLVVGDARFAY